MNVNMIHQIIAFSCDLSRNLSRVFMHSTQPCTCKRARLSAVSVLARLRPQDLEQASIVIVVTLCHMRLRAASRAWRGGSFISVKIVARSSLVALCEGSAFTMTCFGVKLSLSFFPAPQATRPALPLSPCGFAMMTARNETPFS